MILFLKSNIRNILSDHAVEDLFPNCVCLLCIHAFCSFLSTGNISQCCISSERDFIEKVFKDKVNVLLVSLLSYFAEIFVLWMLLTEENATSVTDCIASWIFAQAGIHNSQTSCSPSPIPDPWVRPPQLIKECMSISQWQDQLKSQPRKGQSFLQHDVLCWRTHVLFNESCKDWASVGDGASLTLCNCDVLMLQDIWTQPRNLYKISLQVACWLKKVQVMKFLPQYSASLTSIRRGYPATELQGCGCNAWRWLTFSESQ